MADQKKLGASPSERKRIAGDRKSKAIKGAAFAKKKSNLTKGFGDLPAGSPIKGGMDRDLAKLNKMKADAKAFEKTLAAKRKAEAQKLTSKNKTMFSGAIKKKTPVSKVQKKDAKISKPRMGFTPKALSIKGASGLAGKRLKRI